MGIEAALLRPVRESERATAIQRLEQIPFIAIDESTVKKLTGTDTATAPQMVDAIIAELEERKARYKERRTGTWAFADDDRLRTLQVLRQRQDLKDLKPFLVRGVAKPGSKVSNFGAGLCGDTLLVSHGSAGQSVPPSTRAPIVIFLLRAPSAVYVMWMIFDPQTLQVKQLQE